MVVRGDPCEQGLRRRLPWAGLAAGPRRGLPARTGTSRGPRACRAEWCKDRCWDHGNSVGRTWALQTDCVQGRDGRHRTQIPASPQFQNIFMGLPLATKNHAVWQLGDTVRPGTVGTISIQTKSTRAPQACSLSRGRHLSSVKSPTDTDGT